MINLSALHIFSILLMLRPLLPNKGGKHTADSAKSQGFTAGTFSKKTRAPSPALDSFQSLMDALTYPITTRTVQPDGSVSGGNLTAEQHKAIVKNLFEKKAGAGIDERRERQLNVLLRELDQVIDAMHAEAADAIDLEGGEHRPLRFATTVARVCKTFHLLNRIRTEALAGDEGMFASFFSALEMEVGEQDEDSITGCHHDPTNSIYNWMQRETERAQLNESPTMCELMLDRVAKVREIMAEEQAIDELDFQQQDIAKLEQVLDENEDCVADVLRVLLLHTEQSLPWSDVLDCVQDIVWYIKPSAWPQVESIVTAMIRKSKAKLPGGDFSDGDEYEDLHTGEIPSDPAAFHDHGKPWSTLNHEKRTAWRKANPPTTGFCGLPMDLGIFNPVVTIRDRRHLKKTNKACAKEAREILSQLPTDMNIFKEGIAPEQWSNIRSTCTGGLTHTKKHNLRDKQELAEAVGINGLSCNTLLFRSLPWPAETADRKFKHRRGRFIRRHLDVNGRISSDTMRRWHKMVKQQNARDKRERQLQQQVFVKQTVVPTDPVVFHDGGKIWTMPDHSQRLALKKGAPALGVSALSCNMHIFHREATPDTTEMSKTIGRRRMHTMKRDQHFNKEWISELPSDMDIFLEGIDWPTYCTRTERPRHTRKMARRQAEELASCIGICGLPCDNTIFGTLPTETMVKKQAHSAAKHQRKLQRREEAENKRILARIPTDPTIFMDEDQLTKPITRTIRHQRRMSRHVLARPVFREMLTKGGGGARASISGPSTAALRLPPPAIKLPESRRRRRSSLINQVYLKLLPNSPSLFKPDFRHSTYSGKSRSQLAKDVTKKREQVPNLQKIREQASRKAMDDAVARMRHSAEHLPQQQHAEYQMPSEYQQYVPVSSYTHGSVTSFDQYEAGMPLGLQRPRRSSDLGTMALGHDFGTAHLRMPTGQNTGIDENRQSQSSSRPCTPLNDVTHPSKIYSPLVKP